MENSGSIDFLYGGGTFERWYTTLGDVKNSVKRPLVVLHGGLGFAHNYVLPHFELHRSHGIPTIIYEQIGIGRSTHLRHKPKSFWTLKLFMNELDNVLNHFGIAGNFDLLGHSWGGMLAGNYAAEREPEGLKHLIIASAPASMELWVKSTNLLLEKLPEDLKAMLKKHEREGTTDSQEYQEGMQKFYAKHICQIDPFPELLQLSLGAVDEDPTVYSTMVGPSEFNVTGTLRSWNIIDILDRIRCPTLVTNGKDDEFQDICVLPFFQKIAKVKWVQFSKSHIPFHEEPERYFAIVAEFLT